MVRKNNTGRNRRRYLTEDNLVSIITKIIEGPAINKNLQRRRNATDSFEDEHRARYENERGESQIKYVERHNMTYPKLTKELDKKNSLINHKVLLGSRKAKTGKASRYRNKPKFYNSRRSGLSSYMGPRSRRYGARETKMAASCSHSKSQNLSRKNSKNSKKSYVSDVLSRDLSLCSYHSYVSDKSNHEPMV